MRELAERVRAVLPKVAGRPTPEQTRRRKVASDRLRWHWPRCWRGQAATQGPWYTLDQAKEEMGVSKPTVTRAHRDGTLLSNGRKGKAVRVACVSVRRWHLDQVLSLVGRYGAKVLAREVGQPLEPRLVEWLLHQERIEVLQEEQRLRASLISHSEI